MAAESRRSRSSVRWAEDDFADSVASMNPACASTPSFSTLTNDWSHAALQQADVLIRQGGGKDLEPRSWADLLRDAPRPFGVSLPWSLGAERGQATWPAPDRACLSSWNAEAALVEYDGAEADAMIAAEVGGVTGERALKRARDRGDSARARPARILNTELLRREGERLVRTDLSVFVNLAAQIRPQRCAPVPVVCVRIATDPR